MGERGGVCGCVGASVFRSSSYFVITVFDNGVLRVKEEARPNRPPKMVRHDRVRRFVQEEPVETPRWVRDAIRAFNRRKHTSTKTEEVIERELEPTLQCM